MPRDTSQLVATSADSRTWLEGDGSYRVEISSAPERYWAGSTWQDIDPEWVATTSSEFSVRTDDSAYLAKLPSDALDSPIELRVGEHHISMQMHGLDGGPVMVGDDAVYHDARNATEVVYSAQSAGLKEDIILAEPPSIEELRYTFDFTASAGVGLTKNDDGSVTFVDSSGRQVAHIPAGVMSDAAPHPGVSTGVAYHVTETEAGWRLTVEPDMNWLLADERVYPVAIDPSLVVQPTRGCTINTADPDGSHCAEGDVYIRAGRNSGTRLRRGLVRFGVGSIPADVTVTDASLQLYLDATANNNSGEAAYGIYNASRNWNSQATWNSSGMSGPWDGAWEGQERFDEMLLVGDTSEYKTFGNVGPLVQKWIDGSLNQNGFLIRQTGEDQAHELAFYSDASTTPSSKLPILTVNYTVPVYSDPGCETVVNGDTYVPPSPPATATIDEIEEMEAAEANTCFTYGTEETCDTDPTQYVSAGCPAVSTDPNDRSTGAASDDDPVRPDDGAYIDPDLAPRTCVDCSAGGPGFLWAGLLNGPMFATGAAGAFWTTAVVYGDVIDGIAKSTDKAIDDIEAWARKLKVPWPDPNSTTAKKYRGARYKVYQIYALKDANHGFRTWKYGITRQPGGARPSRQVPTCESKTHRLGMGRPCAPRWIRKNVQGYYRARVIEATFAARYVSKYGSCPKGMPKCL